MIKFSTFIEQKDNDTIVNNLYEMLTFTEYILKELQNCREIELVQYQKWKNYMNKYESLKININNIDNSMLIEEIQKNKEKIINFLQNLKEHEFISDYFSIQDTENQQEEISDKKSEDKNSSYEKFLKIKQSLENQYYSHPVPKNIFELLALSSNEYLKEKLNMDDDQIQILKGKENICIRETEKEKRSHVETRNDVKDENQTLKTNYKLNKILKIKSDLPQKNKISSFISDPEKQSGKFDKEMEEEINKEIFSYTKNMKNYARNFGEIISTDNKKLTKIEKNQEKDQILTDSSMKKLKEFHYDLKIGFFKLIGMFLMVIVAFITTLIIIRLFPKLVK